MSDLKDKGLRHEDIMQKHPDHYHEIADVDDIVDLVEEEDEGEPKKKELRRISLGLRDFLGSLDMDNEDDSKKFYEALKEFKKKAMTAKNKEIK